MTTIWQFHTSPKLLDYRYTALDSITFFFDNILYFNKFTFLVAESKETSEEYRKANCQEELPNLQ